jgi:protein-tyrosine phosphatase
MKLLTHAQNGVLYHCTAGKDRTGVISALLLSLVGVSSHDIISNYEISYSNLKPMIEKLHTQNPNLPPFIGHSKAVYMKMFLDLFYNRYCSPETYLTKIGLTKEEITTLKGKLVDF